MFGGAGWVLFSRDRHAPREVYNDADSSLVGLFRCVKHHTDELIREIDSLCLNSRELFEDFKSQMAARGLTDIQRAARFYLLIRISFGADRRSFGCSERNILDKTEYLRKVKERLKKVIIENRDFERIFKVYDKPGSLFYVDPPYYKAEDYYNGDFTQDDHIRLKKLLDGVKGYFILSYNDSEFIRELYRDYNITSVSRQNNLSSKGGAYEELIIKNY